MKRPDLRKINPAKKVKGSLIRSRPAKKIIALTQKKKFPGYPEISWYAVLEFFLRWVDKKDLQLRASSLSFTFFMALFPSVIFIFTLIAYLPFGGSEDDILVFFEGIMPKSAFDTIHTTLEDILKKQRGGLLSLGFVTAMYFSTNGFVSLMNALNKYGKKKETRSFWKQRLVALILAMVVSLSLLISVILLTVGNYLIAFLDQLAYFPSKITPVLLFVLNFSIVSAIILTIVSAIYYFAPSQTSKWRFITPGSVFACITILVTTMGFSTYVNHFNSYNKVYGSIGVLIVIMLLIYLNTYILLLGYEFNVAVDKAAEEVKKGSSIKANRIVMLRSESRREAEGH